MWFSASSALGGGVGAGDQGAHSLTHMTAQVTQTKASTNPISRGILRRWLCVNGITLDLPESPIKQTGQLRRKPNYKDICDKTR